MSLLRTLLLVCVACGTTTTPGGAELFVDVRTDMVPGFEFDSVVVELSDRRLGEGEPANVQRALDVGVGDDEGQWARGRRVASFLRAATGDAYVYVELFLGERRVIRNVALTDLREGDSVGVTVLLTRDCRGVECPAPGGNPGHIACLRGSCVDPRCPNDPSFCPMAECAVDAECPDVAEACAEALCTDEGFCLFRARSEECDEGEVCSPDLGCVLRETGMGRDAGADGGSAEDATTGDAGVDGGCSVECDTGNPCEVGVECGAGCELAGVKPENARCPGGFCDGAGTCVPCAAGEPCVIEGSCERGLWACGESAECVPGGPPAPALEACADGVCDGLGACVTCVAELPCAPASECRTGVLGCGDPPTCDEDGDRPAGVSCAGGVCDGAGSCVPCDAGAPCDTGNECAVGALSCESGAPVCEVVANRLPNVACAGGICDGEGACVDNLETVIVRCGSGAPLAGDLCRDRGWAGASRVVGYGWWQCGGPGVAGGASCPGGFEDDDTCADWCSARDCVGASYCGARRIVERVGDGGTTFDAGEIIGCGGHNPGWNLRLRCTL